MTASFRLPNLPICLPACVLALALLPSAAHALKSDRNQPMAVVSGNADVLFSDDGTAQLTGGVTITQGSLRIEADDVVMKRQAQEVSHVTLTGNPAVMSQDKDGGGTTVAHAQRIEYDVSAERIELIGNVDITEPGGSLRGEHLLYDLATGRIVTQGGDGAAAGDGRVHLLLQPASKSDASQSDANKSDDSKP